MIKKQVLRHCYFDFENVAVEEVLITNDVILQGGFVIVSDTQSLPVLLLH